MSFDYTRHLTKIINILNNEHDKKNINMNDYISILETIISNIKNNLSNTENNKIIISVINKNNINFTIINKKLAIFNKDILLKDEFNFNNFNTNDDIVYSNNDIVLKNLKIQKKSETKKLWADFSDDEDDYSFEECSTSVNTAASLADTYKNISKNIYDSKDDNTMALNEKMFKKYKNNCETTIKYIIDKYNTNHYDSYKNIKEVNLILYRLMGIDHKNKNKKAYSKYCWFLRNNKCNYESNCKANNFNMCTYAHKSTKDNIQYCCSTEEGFYNWPDNYYKCLKKNKIGSDDDLCEYIENIGENALNLEEIELIPDFVKKWYNNIVFNFNNESQKQLV